MPKDKEIEDFDQLKVEYQKAKEEAEKHIKSDIKKFAELTKALPSIALEATSRGINDKIQDIDNGFDEVNFSEIESEMSIGLAAGMQQNTNGDWAKDNASRSKVITNSVTNAKNKMTNMKAKMALSAVKVTSLVGKGLVLFGQKGLAKSMQENVAEKGKDFVTKDSRAGKIMEKVAEGGFTVADGARTAATTVKNGVENTVDAVGRGAKFAGKAVRDGATFTAAAVGKGAKAVKDGVVNTVETIEDGAKKVGKVVKDEVNDRKQAFKDAGTRADLDQMSIVGERATKNRESDQWQQAHEGRSSIVTNTVKNIDKFSTNLKTKLALGSIKLTGMYAKGAALFGAKGLAEKMQDDVYKINAENMSKDAPAVRVAKAAAEKGFKVSDKFKENVDHTVEMAGAVKEAVKETAKETVQKGRDAIDDGKTFVKGKALEFGKKTYRGAAKIGALGSVGLEAVKTGAGKVAEKAGQGANFVADKVEDGVGYVADKVEDGVEFVSDKIEDAKDYKTVAMARLSKQKSVASKGFKGFLQGMAQGIVDRLAPSIDKDQKNIDAQDQIIDNTKNKGSQSVEPQVVEDDGPEL